MSVIKILPVRCVAGRRMQRKQKAMNVRQLDENAKSDEPISF